MEMYLPIKSIHMLTAYITAFLFVFAFSLRCDGQNDLAANPVALGAACE